MPIVLFLKRRPVYYVNAGIICVKVPGDQDISRRLGWEAGEELRLGDDMLLGAKQKRNAGLGALGRAGCIDELLLLFILLLVLVEVVFNL